MITTIRAYIHHFETMSGRLVISGKKSYTPWNQKNIERVLRDERIAKEKGEADAEQKRQREGNLRISSLKKRLKLDSLSEGSGNDDKSSIPQLQHFNLFEYEELAHKSDAIMNQEKKKDGIMPVYLVAKDVGEISENDFYKRSTRIQIDLDDKMKRNLDPMRRFCKDKSSKNKAENVNENLINHRGRDHRESKDSTMTDLRKRQMERQKKYALREEQLRHKI